MAQATMERRPATVNGKQHEAPVLDAAINETMQRRQSVAAAAATILGVAPARLCDLLRNVWKTSNGQPPLTDQEMFAGISMIARFELDPISKEVYVTRDSKGRLLTIVGIDGWVKILDRTEHYDGFEQEIHATDDGEIDWVETKIFSTKRRHPSVYRAFMSEYMRLGGFVAKTIPSHMLRLFSLRHAARLFTPLGGSVVTEEEAQWMMRAEPPVANAATTAPSTLDELADRLSQPITTPVAAEPEAEPNDEPLEQQSDASQSAPTSDLYDALDAAASLTAVTDVWSRFAGKVPSVELEQACEARREQIRSKRGSRSEKGGAA